MIIGTTKHEFTTTTYAPQLRSISKEDAIRMLESRYGDATSRFVDLVGKAYPGYKTADLLDLDFTFRPSALEQAMRKCRQNGAPVYLYMFCWESPVLDGILRSTHCMEIPFVFNNAGRHASMTGGGKQALELAAKMSHSWANFARTGNPNTEELPEWEEFDCTDRATMLFDNESRIAHNHDKELIDFIRTFPTRGF